MSTYIPLVIFVSSCIDSLLIVRSLVFPRESWAMLETLKLLLGVVIARVSGLPAVWSDNLCQLPMNSCIKSQQTVMYS